MTGDDGIYEYVVGRSTVSARLYNRIFQPQFKAGWKKGAPILEGGVLYSTIDNLSEYFALRGFTPKKVAQKRFANVKYVEQIASAMVG